MSLLSRYFTAHTSYFPEGFFETAYIRSYRRPELYRDTVSNTATVVEALKTIRNNSSLRLNFYWSFESMGMLESVITDCLNIIKPPLAPEYCSMISDPGCNWIGFKKYNDFTCLRLQETVPDHLVEFNETLVEYQSDVAQFISNHCLFKQHEIIRDDVYRYNTFSALKDDREQLYDAFQYTMESLLNTSGVSPIPLSIVEAMIGCHYLRHPDIFFELVDFNILQGNISNE